MRLELSLNGSAVQLEVDEDMPLLDVLRDELGLTGSKYGCGEGQCGACTVLLDGSAACSCVTPISAAAGRDVLTIEGVERDGELHPLQQSFLDAGAFQCGYCTPGMIMAGLALLERCPDPSEAQVVAALQGNICRCGGYRRIVRAVRLAAERINAGSVAVEAS